MAVLCSFDGSLCGDSLKEKPKGQHQLLGSFYFDTYLYVLHVDCFVWSLLIKCVVV